jgi:hypothetical protein
LVDRYGISVSQMTKHTWKIKDRVLRNPLKTGGELRCFGTVGNSCSTSGTHSVHLITNPVISREWGKDREVFKILIAALVSSNSSYKSQIGEKGYKAL